MEILLNYKNDIINLRLYCKYLNDLDETLNSLDKILDGHKQGFIKDNEYIKYDDLYQLLQDEWDSLNNKIDIQLQHLIKTILN